MLTSETKPRKKPYFFIYQTKRPVDSFFPWNWVAIYVSHLTSSSTLIIREVKMRTIYRVQILILGVISTISRVLPAPANFPIRQPPPGQNVFVPPDIKYWAYGKINTTVIDNLGLPWYCYTNRQTHCMPLFQKPPNFQTTRRPYGLGSSQNGILQPSDIQPEQVRVTFKRCYCNRER